MEEAKLFGNAPPTQQMENQPSNFQYGYQYQFPTEQLQPPPQETAPPTDESNDDKFAKQKHAVDFLQKVRMHYLKSPNVYNTFLEIMKDFKSAAIDTPEVITRVRDLFRGNKMLLQEFNSFLPPGFKIEVADSPESANQPFVDTDAVEQNGQGASDNATRTIPPTNDLEHARNYVRKIKNRFIHQPNIYKQFLEILHSYYQGQHAINEVLKEVADLFKTHTDLLEEFRQFLPKSVSTQETVIPSNQSQALHEVTSKKQKRKTVKSRDRDYDDKEEVYTATSTRTRSAALQEERERERELARESGPLTRRRFGSTPQSQPAPKETAHPPQVVYGYGYGYGYAGMPYLDREAREREREMDERKRRRVDDPSSNNSPSKDGKKIEVAQEMALFDELRGHLGSKALLFELLRCMVLYYQEVVERNELHNLGKKLLGSEPKLYEKFKRFLAWDEGETADEDPESINQPSEPMAAEPTSEATTHPDNNNTTTEASTEGTSTTIEIAPTEGELKPIKAEPGVNNNGTEAAPTPAAAPEPEPSWEEDFDETELTLLIIELLLEMNNACVRAIEGSYEALQDARGRAVTEKLDACHIRVLERLYNDKARDIVVALETMPKASVPVVVRRLKVRNTEYHQQIAELKEEKAKEKEKEKEREKEVVVNA
mmetsp:Transcript_7657/g.10569  ORF Transcript_7657/g.10569 Transcript_7657/m.10569 type:complete len:657 (-) Transcript_7657:47-2017(-)